MSEKILEELYCFLHAVVTGVILAMVYDVLRIIRRVKVHGWIVVAIEDFIYWLGSALYIFSVLIKDNHGIIRWFFIIGIFMGMMVYNLTCSQYLVGVLSKIIGKILNIVEKLLKILLRPMWFLWIKTKKMLSKCGNFCRKIKKSVKKPLKNCFKTIRIGLCKK